MAREFNIRQTSVAEDIVTEYSGFFKHKISVPTGDFSSRKIEELVKEGNLRKLLYLNYISNVLSDPMKFSSAFEKGGVDFKKVLDLSKKAEFIRMHNYQTQMDALNSNIGLPIVVHTAVKLKKPSVAIDCNLLGVNPYRDISTDLYSLIPFIQYDGTAICAIENQNGKYIYVNPQVFLRSVVEEFDSDREGRNNGDPLLVKKYDYLLRQTFGDTNVNKSQPWLRLGRLAPK